MKKTSSFLLGLILFLSCDVPVVRAADSISAIRLNQIGYYPSGIKRFVLSDSTDVASFQLVDLNKDQVVFTDTLSEPVFWDLSNELVRTGDFTTFRAPGKYVIRIEGQQDSYPFRIGDDLYQEALRSSARAYYYHRVGLAISQAYGGDYAWEGGHPDVAIPFHPSVGRTGTLDAPGGWYDAGDYGKYVVNGAYSLGELLVLYESYPNTLGDGALNIPESGNGIPDYLDELKYEMDWLLRMQDSDGGVFFKLTTERFEGMVMPNETSKQRYVFRKSTTATLDFAAVAAKFARAIQPYDETYANQCLTASRKAWKWGAENPDIRFLNPEGVITGQYGDQDFSQEFYWAAAELWIATEEQAYLDYIRENPVGFKFDPGDSWASQMHYLGAYALMDQQKDVALAHEIKELLTAEADRLLKIASENAYFQPVQTFHWGSNSDLLNTAMTISQVYRHTGDAKYLAAVQEITDYIFGKNALDVCFLTGFGIRYPVNIHHRLSEADAIEGPIPGFLSGGPNYFKQDAKDVSYPEVTYPMTSWVDQLPSYASNEICINWNAPLTYVLGFLEEESN